MRTATHTLHTGTAPVTDVTALLRRFASGDPQDGLLHAFLPHATCGLALIETGAGSEPDLLAVLDRLLPSEQSWSHAHGSSGHGRDHVLPSFISPSLVLPVVDGALALGRWQSVVVVDTNVDNPERSLRLSFLPG